MFLRLLDIFLDSLQVIRLQGILDFIVLVLISIEFVTE